MRFQPHVDCLLTIIPARTALERKRRACFVETSASADQLGKGVFHAGTVLAKALRGSRKLRVAQRCANTRRLSPGTHNCARDFARQLRNTANFLDPGPKAV